MREIDKRRRNLFTEINANLTNPISPPRLPGGLDPQVLHIPADPLREPGRERSQDTTTGPPRGFEASPNRIFPVISNVGPGRDRGSDFDLQVGRLSWERV